MSASAHSGSTRPRPRLRALLLALCAPLAFALLPLQTGHATPAVGLAITGMAPASGYPGVAVTLTGLGFTGATGVAFNGTAAACFTVDSETQITAVVPPGAASGPITVSTPFESGDSPSAFTVLAAGAGKIAFTSYRDGNAEIYAIAPDGSGETRLTFASEFDTYPAASPDGTKIAFASERDYNREIYVMNADGSGQTRLTAAALSTESSPAFSPDGRMIAFESDRDGGVTGIYLMRADGSSPVRLSPAGTEDYAPAFSPDGTKIAFTSMRDGNWEIYVMNVDGSGQTRLTDNAVGDINPAFSPDGGTIVFASKRDGNYEIYRMHADGSDPVRLTTETAADDDPVFSPDGTRILFTSRRNGTDDLYLMKTDGSGQTRLTTHAAHDRQPTWGSGALLPLTGVTLAGAPGNVPLAGQALTFTATPEGGSAPEYAFTVTLKDIQADFSHREQAILTDAAYTADPTRTFTAVDPGRYAVTVSCREAGTEDPRFMQTLNVRVGCADLTGATALTADQPSGIVLDAVPAGGITLTAAITGTGAGVQYFFSGTLRDVGPDGTATNVPVVLSAARSADPTCAWHPTEPGYYTLRVIAADATCNLAYSAWLTFLVRDPSLTGLAFSASPGTGVRLDLLPPGGITLTGTPAGTGAGVEYFFAGILKTRPDGTVVDMPAAISPAWSPSPACAWQPAEAGTYQLTLTARDATCNTTLVRRMTCVVRPPILAGVARLAADPPSGLAESAIPAGGILLAAAPAPAAACVEYFYAAKRRDYRADGSWTDVPVPLSADWSADPDFRWTPAGPGLYLVTVAVRDTWYAVTARRTISYLVTPSSLTGIAVLAADPPSGTIDAAVPAAGILLTATPAGSGAGAEYFFSARLKDVAEDGSTTIVPADLSAGWSPDPTCAWHPDTPGTYTLTVRARDAGRLIVVSRNLVYLLKSATLTGLTGFTPDAASGTALADLPPGGVTFTAAIAGAGTGVRYRYQVGKSNGMSYDYGPLTDYTGVNTFTFAPVSAGVYRLWCFAYDATCNTRYSIFTNFTVR